jgi:hypothetical protein
VVIFVALWVWEKSFDIAASTIAMCALLPCWGHRRGAPILGLVLLVWGLATYSTFFVYI